MPRDITAVICQLCQRRDRLYEVLDLGQHPPSDGFLSREQLDEKEIFYPLRVFFCQSCTLVQLSYAVDPAVLFGEQFIYRSGFNNPLKEHLQSIAKYLVSEFKLTTKDLAIDIGSNDGSLLQGYLGAGIRMLGVESSGVARIALEAGVPTIKAFFNEKCAKEILRDHGKADVITATNVFAHVRDLRSFMAGVNLLLEDTGVFLTESHYLLDMVEKVQYDEIYLEHLRYYSLESIVNLMSHFGMDVFDVTRVSTHGGSIRVLACKKGTIPISGSVQALLNVEKEYGLNAPETFDRFRLQVRKNRQQLMGILHAIRARGERIVGVGAPAKGNTLLNFCKIGGDILDYLVEKSDLKIGKYTPGTHIEVVDESRLFQDQPEYALLLSWNIKEELIPKFRNKGYRGKFIVPNPVPAVE